MAHPIDRVLATLRTHERDAPHLAAAAIHRLHALEKAYPTAWKRVGHPAYQAYLNEDDATSQLRVDASHIHKRYVDVRQSITSSTPIEALVYPKWIQGQHAPSGDVMDVVDLRISSKGQSIPYTRGKPSDERDLYSVHLATPATDVEVAFTFVLESAGPSTRDPSHGVGDTSRTLAVVDWQHYVMYPAHSRQSHVWVTPTILLPREWHYATSLKPYAHTDQNPNQKAGARRDPTHTFAEVTLEQLVDSPVMMGKYVTEHRIDDRHRALFFGETPRHARLPPGWDPDAVVDQVHKAFGKGFYPDYTFLVGMSDYLEFTGLEHHASTDIRSGAGVATSATAAKLEADVMTHEYVHSWNGKHRRPAGEFVPDLQVAYDSEELWVYEGQTQFWGDLLTTRAGIWSVDDLRGRWALELQRMATRDGRATRSLAETSRDAPYLYGAPGTWQNARRGTDFYDEGVLLWSEVDATLRTRSRHSMDDFAASFLGCPQSETSHSKGCPVMPYTVQDIYQVLRSLEPTTDWQQFFEERVFQPRSAPSLERAVEKLGYRYVHRAHPSSWQTLHDEHYGIVNLIDALGFKAGESGRVYDVRPSRHTGLIPGTSQIVDVNGEPWSRDAVHRAVARRGRDVTLQVRVYGRETSETERIVLPVATLAYPHLERISGTRDILGDMAAAK